MTEEELEMGSFSINEKNMMRKAQRNRCARCLNELGENEGEAHEVFQDNVYGLQGILLCNNCHKPNYSYGIPPLRIGNSLNQLM